MKDRRIEIRVSEELYNMLVFKASASDKKLSEFVRECIVSSDVKIDNSKDILKLVFQMNKIGNNINQIAHKLNIAHNSNKMNDINYTNLLDELIVIEHFLKELSDEFI